MRTEGLLERSQQLTAELQSRQSELTKKQEELHATNEQLQEKAQLLEDEKKQVENKNREIEMARRAVEEKAEQLALTSKYKSEFLANMSHELRTPLNSLLILSNLLAGNQQGNLNEKQVEFARTINSAGTDLLSLINDILDLSKIESGTVTVDIGDMPIAHLRQHVERTFRQIAIDKGLGFGIDVDPQLPDSIRTDEKRLQQLILNLLSNAFKFTSVGEVRLQLSVAPESEGPAVAIAVTDTGIGIPQDKQKLIFEAFQQADGTTSRKYGGTGLGLSISREIARLLGGELRVESAPGKGSTFTLVLPLAGPQAPAVARASAVGAVPTGSHAPVSPVAPADDRDAIHPGDRVLLIVEDDPGFANVLLQVARSAGLRGIVSVAGSGTLSLARKFMPDAITLDLGLADIDGGVLFDLLKHDPKTRSIPIYIVSGADHIDLGEKGAAGVLMKPVSSEQLRQTFQTISVADAPTRRSVLVADADSDRRLAIIDAVRDGTTTVTAVSRLPANSDARALSQYDAIIFGISRVSRETALDLSELAERIGPAASRLIVYAPNPKTSRPLLKALQGVTAAKRADNLAQLPGLLAELLPTADRPPPEAASAPEQTPTDLADAKVLIVDDDIRNIYSLTSVLETYGVKVLHAERARDGIAVLEKNPDVFGALVDIMMPEMHGYQTMREIRGRPALADLPIISVTAKAMRGDRRKYLEAGASDYIAKPVDLELLMALLRVWIARSRDRAHDAMPLSAAK
jgi:signal transduction histidine kinase/DNA-binding response OmpR family regulator